MSLILRPLALGLEWLVALAITAVAAFLFLNGSFFASYDADHVDLSINLNAAHALRDGENPYGRATLLERAREVGGPTFLIYDQVYTSYIQPPTSALSLLPYTTLSWRDGTHLYLYLNHVFLLAGIAVTLLTVRPTVRLPWVFAGVAILLAAFASIPFSFSLGQVDGTMVFLLSVGFWAYSRGHAAVAGATIAFAAAIKIIPGLLLLYFLWKRDYRIVLWGAAVGLAFLLASAAYVGADVYRTYITETLPLLTKGSSHYSNAALSAVIARSVTPPLVDGAIVRQVPEMMYLDDIASGARERLMFLAIELAGLLAVAAVVRPNRRAATVVAQPTAPSDPPSVEPKPADEPKPAEVLPTVTASQAQHPRTGPSDIHDEPSLASPAAPSDAPSAQSALGDRPNSPLPPGEGGGEVTSSSPPAERGPGGEVTPSPAGASIFEYYFVIAVGLLISSSTWDFYAIWLLPVFVVAFLAPGRVLPASPLRWAFLTLFAIALVGLNFPGDLYLFKPNAIFYHPDWVVGKWVEDRVLLYHNHLDAVILLRLPSLLLLAITLGLLSVWHRRRTTSTA